MQQRLFILVALLLTVLHTGTSFASTKVDVNYYEDAALEQRYNNVCLIRNYRGKVLLNHSTGTLCEKDNKRFILFAQNVKDGTRLTADFGDGAEREIEDFKVLTDFMKGNTEETLFSAACSNGRSDMVMGFLSSYPENIIPARLVSLKTCMLSNDHRTMPHNQEIILLWNLIQVKNQPCHLVGLGSLISPWSHPDLFLRYQNKGLKKTVITGKISFEVSENEAERRDLFFSTFMEGGNHDVARCERPITSGFVGGSLRAANNEVVAVASHVDELEMMEELQQLHPLKAMFLGSWKRVAECCSAKVFYRVKLRHLALVGAGAYACFSPSEAGTIVGFGMMAIAFNLMESLYEDMTENLSPLRLKSYYIPVLPFMGEIDAQLEAYADSSSENGGYG